MFVILIGLHLHFSTDTESADRMLVREPLGSKTKVLLAKVLFPIEMTEDIAKLKIFVNHRFSKKKILNPQLLRPCLLHKLIRVTLPRATQGYVSQLGIYRDYTTKIENAHYGTTSPIYGTVIRLTFHVKLEYSIKKLSVNSRVMLYLEKKL